MKVRLAVADGSAVILNGEGQPVLSYKIENSAFEVDVTQLGEAIAFTMTKFAEFQKLVREAEQAAAQQQPSE